MKLKLCIPKVDNYHHRNVSDQIQCKHQHCSSQLNNQESNNHKKWATFTYVGKETKFMAKVLKDHKRNIAFHAKTPWRNTSAQRKKNPVINGGQ
jgi:hypothetical protein